MAESESKEKEADRTGAESASASGRGRRENQRQPRMTEWDAAYPCSIEMELRTDKGMYVSERQKPLGHFPLRADMFIQKTDDSRPFRSVIAKRFQKYNFIEFKAPDDELGIDAFFKALAQAALFKVSAPSEDAFKVEEITCTFVRQRKPARLMKRLAEEFGYRVRSEYGGIYYVERICGKGFFVQIIVVRELDMGQCGWLGIMKRNISREEFMSFLASSEALEDVEDRRNADTINDIVVKANAGSIKKWMEDTEMSDAMREIMKDDLENAHRSGVRQGMQQGIQQGIQQGMQQGIQQGIQQGMQQGIQQGMQQGVRQGIRDGMLASIRNLMDSTKWTLDKAMESLKIPPEQREMYAGLLGM